MSEKVQDIIELIKFDRRVRIFGLLVLLGLFFVTFCSEGKKERSFGGGGGPVVTKPNSVDIQGGDVYTELLQAFKEDLEQLQDSQQENLDFQKRVRNDYQRFESEVADIFESLSDKQEILEDELKRVNDKLTREPAGPDTSAVPRLPSSGSLDIEPVVEDELEPISFNDEDEAIKKLGPPPEITRIATISAGDSVAVELLTGVNAPTDGTPYPVVFKLAGPISGPDGSTLDLGEGRLLATAQGSEIDGRAVFRLQNLAIRHKDGRRSVVDIDGWIVGEDGIRGMQGRLVDKLGSFIVSILGTTFSADLLSRLADNGSNVDVNDSTGVNISGDEVGAAFTTSLNEAGQRLVDVYINRLERLIPVVEILAGRTSAAVFSSSVEVYICQKGQCGGGEGLEYVSLD